MFYSEACDWSGGGHLPTEGLARVAAELQRWQPRRGGGTASAFADLNRDGPPKLMFCLISESVRWMPISMALPKELPFLSGKPFSSLSELGEHWWRRQIRWRRCCRSRPPESVDTPDSCHYLEAQMVRVRPRRAGSRTHGLDCSPGDSDMNGDGHPYLILVNDLPRGNGSVIAVGPWASLLGHGFLSKVFGHEAGQSWFRSSGGHGYKWEIFQPVL